MQAISLCVKIYGLPFVGARELLAGCWRHLGSPVTVKAAGEQVLLLEYIEQRCPSLRSCLIVLTTHVDNGAVLSVAARMRACAVLAKPFDTSDLVSVVADCLAGRHDSTHRTGISEAHDSQGHALSERWRCQITPPRSWLERQGRVVSPRNSRYVSAKRTQPHQRWAFAGDCVRAPVASNLQFLPFVSADRSRASRGLDPVHRLNARENEAGSAKPRR